MINVEDEYGQRLDQAAARSRQELITYGIDGGDFHAKDVSIETQRNQVHSGDADGRISDLESAAGAGERLNLIAASAAAYARDVEPSAIAEAADELAQVPGRFERVDVGQPFTVIVDYAHTDDALRNLTAVARDFLAQRGGQGRVITVFGCGGDRDRSKRPLMGEAAGAGSDFVVLTSDNPRSENPLDIMNDALPGLQRSRHALHSGTGSRAKPSPWPFTKPSPAISCSSPERATRRSRSPAQAPFRSTTSRWRGRPCEAPVTQRLSPAQSAKS